MNENNLIEKLMISKKIMDRHNEMPRNNSDSRSTLEKPVVEEFQVPDARYNIPSDLMEATVPVKKQENIPLESKINNSKLPDEIKKLMLEHPIHQPNPMSPSNTVLSDNIIEAATRLMNKNPKESVNETVKKPVNQNIDLSSLKPMIKEAVKEILKENGLITESESKSNELFQFKVGTHVFEGKITKIKKLK